MTSRARRAAALLCAGVATAALVPGGAASAAAAFTAPAVDVTVVTAQPTDNDTLTSDAFTTHAGNELLVAMFSTDGPDVVHDGGPPDPTEGPAQEISEVTGCGLTWQPFAAANAEPGATAVYTAWAAHPVTNCQVSGEQRYAYDGLVSVVTFTGADPQLGPAQPFWAGADEAAGGAVDIEADGSLVYQVGHNWTVAAVPDPRGENTASPPQDTPASLVGTYVSPRGDTSWVARLDEPQLMAEPGTDWHAEIACFFPERGAINAVSFSVKPIG
jgi:hypothetical protein